MLVSRASRVAHLELATGAIVSIEGHEVEWDHDRDREWFTKRAEEMAVGPNALAPSAGKDVLDWGAHWMSVARRTLAHDGYHLPLAFLFDKEGLLLQSIGLDFEGQAGKYLAFRRLADAVDRLGAHTVILINEAWEAEVPKGGLSPDMPRASERPDRTEALTVMLATSDGRHRRYHCPFTRDKSGRPRLGDTNVIDKERESVPSLGPLQAVWARWT
jgi:hypothetical protein